jgi:hypothetical protein
MCYGEVLQSVPQPEYPRLNNKRKNLRGKKRSRQNNSSRAGHFMTNAGDQIVKRMTIPSQVLNTGAGVVIAVASISSSLVEANPATEWASFAARYQQYRVRAIRVTGKAVLPIQSATAAHGALYRGDYIGSSAPTTSAQVFSDENVRENATHRDFSDIVTWKRNPNAKLWNPTSAAIPTANQFAWVAARATSPQLTTATTYYALAVEYEVEFRGSQ